MNISYRNKFGKRIFRSALTRLKEKGNRKRAEAMLQEMRRKVTVELDARYNSKGIYADAYFLHWLEMVEPTLSPTTYKAYSLIVRNSICSYFRENSVLLNELKPKHIAEYYDSLLNQGLSTTTVRRCHANIHRALKWVELTGDKQIIIKIRFCELEAIS